MKIYAYETREDEKQDFLDISKALQVEISYCQDLLTLSNVHLCSGYDGITILGYSKIDAQVLDALYEMGIYYITTRTIGYDHIDIAHAKKIGIRIANSGYGPNGVADFTIMLMLMSVRHYKQAMFRGNVNDYSLSGLQGKEMKDLTVGVLGSGKIGATVIESLSGFGSKLLIYDVFENNELKTYGTYVDLETLYRESDIITLHLPLLESTYRLINKDSLSKMKDGVILINCARGELMDIDDIIEGIETRKIGALGLDVFENEEGIYHYDRKNDILTNKQMAYMRQFPNVTMTQHMAFYTDVAVKSMVTDGVRNLVDLFTSGVCSKEI